MLSLLPLHHAPPTTLRLYPASPGWGVRCGCVCLGWGFGCAPPLLAGVFGCVCVCVRAPLVPRHSWLGCAVWVCVLGVGCRLCPASSGSGVGVCVCVCVRVPLVPRHSWLGCVLGICVFGLGFRLRPATPGSGACVCLCARSACAAPLLAMVCGVWVGCRLAPAPVPWFIAGCARCPGLRHPVAVFASHLSLCLGWVRRRASQACLVAPRWCVAPRQVQSLPVLRSASPTPWCLSPPRGLEPRIYWAAAQGPWRPAENRALCAFPWPLPRQRRWARSASYQFGAPQGGCPWRVPRASVLGCVRCGGLRLCTQALTRVVSRTVRLLTGESAGAPGLFRMDANTAPFGWEDVTPGSRACVRVRAFLARFGAPHLCLCPVLMRSLFVRPRSGWGCPDCGCCRFFSPFPCCASFTRAFRVFLPGLPWALASCGPLARAPLFCFWFFFFFFSLCAAVVSGVLCFPARGALGLGVLWSSRPCPHYFSFFSFFFLFVFSFAPSCLRGSVISSPGCHGPCRPPARPRCLFFFCLFFVFLLHPPPFVVFSFCLPCSCFLFVSFFFSFFSLLPFFFCLGVPVVRRLVWYVCPGLWDVVLCGAVGVVPRRGPVCACAVSLGGPWLCPFCVCCCLSCCGVVDCFVFCPPLCGVLVLGLVLAPCCWSPLLLPGPLLSPVAVFCPGVRCCVALGCRLSCGVPLSALCLAGGAVLFCSRWLVLCVVACGYRVFVAGSDCLLLFSAGVCCRGCSRLAAWLAALLCAVVWFGAPLPCAVSRVLWCCVAVWLLSCGALLSVFSLWWCWFVSFPCVALRVVLFSAGLVCAVVGASCCGVSLCVVVSPMAFCGVVVLSWCVVVSCCGVLCSVVLCRLLVPFCWAVLCVFLCCGYSFSPAKTVFRFLKIKKIYSKNKIILHPTHACGQAARPSRTHRLMCNLAAWTLTASSLSSFVFSPFLT